MGKYDDITPERLRADLVGFAQLILRLDREDGVLTSPADLQRLLGDLRQKLFAYEVRAGGMAKGKEKGDEDSPLSDDSTLKNSQKVVREALRREEEMLREWDGDLDEEDVDG